MPTGSVPLKLTVALGSGGLVLTVKLAKGKWQFYCSVHPTTMFGNFTVK